jgi:hypothetical protein
MRFCCEIIMAFFAFIISSCDMSLLFLKPWIGPLVRLMVAKVAGPGPLIRVHISLIDECRHIIEPTIASAGVAANVDGARSRRI